VAARGGKHRLGQIVRDHPPRDAGEGQRGVAAAGGDVENALGPPRGAPGQQPIEIFTRRVQGARHVRRSARAELLLHAADLSVAHFFFGARSAS
jgi:hypothetical protein